MSLLRVGRTLRLSSVVALALLGLALLAACGDGGEDGAQPPAGGPTATEEEAGRTPDAARTPASEAGEAPVFWRTVDNFASLRAGEGYKVVFRVTNGYEEEALPIVAEPEGGGPEVEFEASRVEPGGEEAPGSYYAMNLELPEPGRWQITVSAGDDEATFTVEVKPAGQSDIPTPY
ncbi:MAG: hypothetical protein A2148_06990 [Chloroflexi bacterium RBG_16_68_14]|nr:MAG: hypothetical protein A2148_06990 [Chloroflexi bacterium RBG_16_68_14]